MKTDRTFSFWRGEAERLHAEADRAASIDLDITTAKSIRRAARRAEAERDALQPPSPAINRRGDADDDPHIK